MGVWFASLAILIDLLYLKDRTGSFFLPRKCSFGLGLVLTATGCKLSLPAKHLPLKNYVSKQFCLHVSSPQEYL